MFKIEPGTENDGDVFDIVAGDGCIVARAYTPETAAIICAALIHSQAQPQQWCCPTCHGIDSRVTDTRASDAGILRRRTCNACGARYKTVERFVSLTTAGEEWSPG